MKELLIVLMLAGFALYGFYSAIKNIIKSIYKLYSKYKLGKGGNADVPDSSSGTA